MRKIFQECGGVIVTVIAVVSLIALVTLLMSNNGVMYNAFSSITQSFVDEAGLLVDNAVGETGGTGGAGGSGGELPGNPSGEPVAYLYNGVQLPDINEVWTDKEAYPYACIFLQDNSADTGVSGAIMGSVCFFTALPKSVQDADAAVTFDVDCQYIQYCYISSSLDELFKSEGYDFGWVPDTWTEPSSHNVDADVQIMIGNPLLWSNADILLNTDGSVYLSSSEPVPVYE